MPKKPRQRRGAPLRAANDNQQGVKLALCYAWTVYRAASTARWVGQVIASTADEAIEAAATEFNTDVRKLIAVRRYKVGQS
jgi:hypothetical protein